MSKENKAFIGGSEDMGRYPTTVDEANEWLQKYGKSELKFSSRTDALFGKSYILSFEYRYGQSQELISCGSLSACIEHAVNYFSVPRCW